MLLQKIDAIPLTETEHLWLLKEESRLCEATSFEEYVLDYTDLKTCTINIAFWLWHSSYQIKMIHEKSRQIRHRLPQHVISNELSKGMSQAGK